MTQKFLSFLRNTVLESTTIFKSWPTVIFSLSKPLLYSKKSLRMNCATFYILAATVTAAAVVVVVVVVVIAIKSWQMVLAEAGPQFQSTMYAPYWLGHQESHREDNENTVHQNNNSLQYTCLVINYNMDAKVGQHFCGNHLMDKHCRTAHILCTMMDILPQNVLLLFAESMIDVVPIF